MPSRPISSGASHSRPAPVPMMDVYTADGSHCYSVPKASISHRGTSTGYDQHANASKAADAQQSAPAAMGPVLCAAYSAAVGEKKGTSPSTSPHEIHSPASAGCPLGSRCPNVHIDVPLNTLKTEEVHIHYLWSDESNVTYERLIQPMLRDRPKLGSPQEISNILLEVYGPNNREPYEMIPAGKVLHTRGARYAFDAAIGTPNRTPSTSRPCHCAHYYFNQVCNRGASCAFIHVVSVDPTQKEPCIKAANYHRRIAILAGDHSHHGTVPQHVPQPVSTNQRNVPTPHLMGGAHHHQVGPTNTSPNGVNFGGTNTNGVHGHHTERIIVRDPREAPLHNTNSSSLNGGGHGGNYFASNSHSPATQMTSDQSIANTRNSPAWSRYSNSTIESGLLAAAQNQQRSTPPTHLMGTNLNNSPAPSVNHQTATPHQSPCSPNSNSNSNATPMLAASGMVGSPNRAPSQCATPPPPPPQAIMQRSPSTSANINGASVFGMVSPSTPIPTNVKSPQERDEATIGLPRVSMAARPASATPPPPPASSLSPHINRPHVNTDINSSFCGGSRQQSEFASHQQSYNAVTLPADDLQDGGEFQQQQHYTVSNESPTTNNMSYNTQNNVSYHSPNRTYNIGSPNGTSQRQTSSALIPAEDVAPSTFSPSANGYTKTNLSPSLSPRTTSYISTGMTPSVVVGEAASKVANFGSSPRTNSSVFVGTPAPVITVGGQVQKTLLPTPNTADFYPPKRTDSFFAETTGMTNGPRFQTPPPNQSPHSSHMPHPLNHNAINASSGPCGNSMFSEGMVGVGMGGIDERPQKGPMTPQTGGHHMGGNTTTSYCNSPSCTPHHITSSNMVTPKSARVPTGRFTHQPYTPPTAMYGTPQTAMHAGTM